MSDYDFFLDALSAVSGADFDEIPVHVEEFVKSEEYLGLPPLSDNQYSIIKAGSQIYRKETLIDIYGEDEGEKRFRETFNEVILALGKGCHVASDEVYDATTGQWHSFAELTGSTEGYSVGVNGNSLESEFRTEAFCKGEEEVFEVTLDTGHVVTVSADHKFVTKDGLKPLREINGEHVAIAARLPITAPVAMDERIVKLLGYWLGDGMMPRDGQEIINMDFAEHEINSLNEYVEICKSLGDDPTVTKHKTKKMWFVRTKRNSPLHDIVREHGMWGARANNKRIPKAIFSLPDDQLEIFISRLHGTDGTVYMKKNGDNKPAQPILEYCSISEGLAKDYQRLLGRLGIVARIRNRVPKYTYKGEIKEGQRAYYLTIGEQIGFTRFAKSIPLLDKQEKLDMGLSLYSMRKRSWSRYDGDIYWAKIKSVKEVGTELVYTITASETHTFVSNMVLNGNSGK